MSHTPDPSACLVVSPHGERRDALMSAIAGGYPKTRAQGYAEPIPDPAIEAAIVDCVSDPDAGYKLVSRLKKRGSSVLVVIPDEAEHAEFALEGADEFVREGLARRDLLSRLNVMIGWRRDRNALVLQRRDLQSLLDLTRDFASAIDIPELLPNLVRRLAAELGVIRCSIILTDATKERGVVVAASDTHVRTGIVIELDRYPELREVLRTARPVALADVPSHPLLEGEKEKLERAGVAALAAFPLSIKGEVTGALLLRAGPEHGAFSTREVHFGATVANAIALALRNARMFEALRDEAEERGRTLADYKDRYERVVHTKDFLENLIESSPDAIIASDMRGRVLLFNKAAERICKYTQAEARALNVRQLYAEGVAFEVMRQLRSERFGGVGRLRNLRRQIVTKEGVQVPVSLSAALILEEGKEAATVGIFTDLREKLDVEERLSNAEEKLQQTEKQAMIVELAGTAAHELNQPLTSVMGYAELLRRKLTEQDPSYRSIDIIFREAERMAEIVRKIGRITRYETKPYLGNVRIVDLEKSSDE